MIWLVYFIVLFYAVWVFYLAVMNLKRAKDAGTLTKTAFLLGQPVLYVGLLLDFVANLTLMTVILLELPREVLVTARLKRHIKGTGWRSTVAFWFGLHILNAFDPSGNHLD